MREETLKWLRQAEEDLKTAEACSKAGRLDASAFYSQQTAEKALKAVQIEKLGRFEKVHDLLTLADSVKAPARIIECCLELNSYYTITRYPDIGEPIAKETVKDLLGKAREVVGWAKQAGK
jgi:HEPN domain-containing protein